MTANDKKEKELNLQGFQVVAGCDESGCGTYSGDVCIGLVIFPVNIDYKTLLPGLNDSKQKTPAERAVLYQQVHQHALAYATASASVEEIDNLNIYWARFLAVYRALSKISTKPDYIIMDGNKVIPTKEKMSEQIIKGYANKPEQRQKLLDEINLISLPQQEAIVKGDAKSISIAAASILAKVERDEHIDKLAQLVHPDFDWIHNKGYHCQAQIDAVKKHGRTPYHRQKYYETLIKKHIEGK